MKYFLHRVKTWPYEKLAPYSQALTAAIQKIIKRFPDDISVQNLATNIANGKLDLWLILDKDDQFIAFLTSEIEIALSGKKRLLLLELAGEGAQDLTQFMPQLEAFAKAQGAAEICPYGRLGWKRALANHGYKIATVKYTKDLTNGWKK